MNSSWSDQDRSRESDLTTPDSHSGTSEGEFESFEDGGHHANENNLDYEDPHSDEMDADGLQTNYNQSTEGEAGEDASNTSEHLPHPEAAGEEEAGGVREMLEDSGEALGGSGGPRTDENGEKRHTVLNMHHVDLILDNIDAELNDIINRSLNSEHSEHSYHGNSTSSGQTRSSKRSQKSAMLINSATESSDSETAEGTLEEGSATDTGLGTGSHPGDSSPLPNGENAHHRSAQNVALDRMRQNSNSKKPRKKRIPQRQVVVEFSDVDSICSEDVRMRVEETLHLQDSDKDAPPSQRSHGPSHSHDALQKYYRSPPSDPALNNAQSPYGVCRIPDQMPSDKNEVTSPSDDNNETEEISSRIQKMVSQVLSDSTSDPLFEEVPPPNHDKESLSQNLPITNQDSLRTTSAKNSDGQGGARQPLAPTSQSFLENRRAGRGFDADSIATEDFERVFQKSIVYHEPSSMTSSTPRRTIHNNPSNSNPIKKLATPPPLKKTDRLTVPGMGKRGKSRNRKKRTVTLPASKPSGLPEYMYLRKGVTESDVGSDSIRTEDYEGHFEAARVTDQHNSPKCANLSNLSRGRHTAIVQSDPESIQTEEYEQRFLSLMVKQVAGVPVKSFDQVTIPSDLESVETGMVHQKFQEALRKGPEVRVFNEFGDQSDLDPLQMEEIERKFQAILRKKKIEKIRHSPKEGDTEDEGTSDLDSVRAIPSKSEAGSPPTRQSLNGRSQGRRHQNGAHIKHSGRSGDPSPRASAFNSSRSSSRVPSSPIRSQLTSPWSTPRDISPSPPTQRSPTAVGVHPHFPFGQLVAAKPCPNHEKKNPARYCLAKPYSRENDNHHPGDAARIKLESKRRKKKLLWDGRVKTSTPKANPGGRHQGDSGREMEGDVEEGTNNDHLATVRELLETETKMRRKLDELESSFEEVSSRKQDALTDLKRLREAVHRNKRDIQKAEEIARENMERADGLRSELMVLEYQRDQARRDLEDLTQSIGSIKQSQSHRGTEEVNAGTGTNLLGLSPKEVIAVIKERDELKTRLRNGEGDLSPIERSELERQLNHTKQELFSGQKSSREKLESLQEELEESRHTIEELLVEKTNLAEKVKELQATVGSEHTDGMHSDIEERNLLLEQLSGKLQKELDALRHQTHEKDQRLQSLAASVLEKDKLNDALRDQVLAAQREAEEGQSETERVVREAQGKMRNADVAKELALVELREALLREKEEEMEQLKLSLEKDKKEALTALDQKTSEMMRITQRSLSEKEEDLNVVKMQLVQHTEEANKMEQQLREQAEEQVQAAVEKERRAMEEEYTRRRREENVEKELEVAKETSRLQGELHVTKQRLEQMQTTVGVLKEELDKLREENLAAGREKVEAVSEAREKAREDIQRELDQLREQLAKENLLEADKLRMKIRQQEEEVTRLRSEVKVHQDREAKSAGVTGSKSILAEINEECKRTAAVIGSAPLKMNISRGSKSLNGTRSPKSPLHGMPDSAQGPGRTQVMAALTNLRISNEELRNYVQSLKADLERQKRALSKAQKEKDEEVKKVASTIEKKSGDMDTMRDRLIQDHLVQVEELQQQISRQRTAEASLQQRLLDKDSELKEIQQSMTQWKEETALKMAKKFEEELSKELEIRLQEASKRDGSYRGSQADLRSRNSSGNGSPSTVSSASDASTIRLLRHLQERVKQLRSENMSLRRSSRGPFESSGEERASPHSSKHSESDDKDHLLYQLQQRVKLLERQLQVAEERCRENAASVSEKISENSRLQGALTQQTKELMKMERAYSKLASPTRTPVRL